MRDMKRQQIGDGASRARSVSDALQAAADGPCDPGDHPGDRAGRYPTRSPAAQRNQHATRAGSQSSRNNRRDGRLSNLSSYQEACPCGRRRRCPRARPGAGRSRRASEPGQPQISMNAIASPRSASLTDAPTSACLRTSTRSPGRCALHRHPQVSASLRPATTVITDRNQTRMPRHESLSRSSASDHALLTRN